MEEKEEKRKPLPVCEGCGMAIGPGARLRTDRAGRPYHVRCWCGLGPAE